MSDPVEPASPLAEVYAEVQRSLQATALSVERLLGPLEGALLAFRRALEAQVAKEYAAAHSIRFSRPAGPSREAAAKRLQQLVLALPDFATRDETSPGPDDGLPEQPPAPPAPALSTREAEGASSAPTTKTLADVLPRLAARAGDRTLVVLGALAGRKRQLPEPLASATEWIDTSQGGAAHAAQSLPARIRQGRLLGIVICDQAVSHKHTEPVLAAARAAGVPVGFAGKGGNAGIARALRSIEDQLPG